MKRKGQRTEKTKMAVQSPGEREAAVVVMHSHSREERECRQSTCPPNRERGRGKEGPIVAENE